MISRDLYRYNIVSGDVLAENPLPKRAIETRAKGDPRQAMDVCGIGRIAWDVVQSYSKENIKKFCEDYEIGSLLQGNAKTDKPRPTGRHGVIRGLNLMPHFYANILNIIDISPGGTTIAPFTKRNKDWFNSFNGREAKTAASFSERSEKDLLQFCQGSSKYCRQTCLVTTGQHPSTMQAAYAKAKFTYAFLSEPELFVAVLRSQLHAFARSGKKNGYDPVVRLNMLSDLPWYSMCPELLEELEGEVYFYDYTKLPFWRSPDYKRVEHLLDLTYSYSGSNDPICVEALENGYRVAVVFAPTDKDRSTSVAYRTTWTEIVSSGIVEAGMIVDLFGKGTGAWEIVDGDSSDYRIDDPVPSIVALNFKQPNISETIAPHMAEAVPESRQFFTKKVPDDKGLGIAYARARAKNFWPKVLGITGKGSKSKAIKELDQMDFLEVIRIAHEYETGEPWTEFDVPDVPYSISSDLDMEMALVEGTNLLVGPHVPVVVND